MKAKTVKKKHSATKMKKKGNAKKSMTSPQKQETEVNDLIGGSDSELDDDAGLSDATKMSQGEYLKKLKKSDPQFFKAMMNAEDLDMQSDSEDDDKDDDEQEGGTENDDIFKSPAVLAEQSDEEDSGAEEMDIDDNTNSKNNLITSSVIAAIKGAMEESKPMNAFCEMAQALQAAVESIDGQDDDKTTSKYKVEGPQMFNAVVRLCLQEAAPVLQKILHLKNIDDDPSKSKKWIKLKNIVRPFLRNMVKLTEAITEPEVIVVLLKKGILPLLAYYSAHPIAGKVLARRLITLWATSHQRVRVLSFIAIFRLTKSLKTELLDTVLKKMYLAYVSNCRFTTPSTWGMIDFMRLSLTELYALDYNIAYKQAFIYIRQMAFHLRNAILDNRKEKVQLVYNWQYIHCLHMWADLLSKVYRDSTLEPLIYPLTQIAIGTMKLQASTKFYPLIFHICSILTDLSMNTETFIPILPFLLQVINSGCLNKKHTKASIKPFQFICMLKLSKSQMMESAFKDEAMNQFYSATLKYLNVEAASIAFPELVIPAICQLRDFLKKSKNQNFTKKIKHLLEKITENKNFITERRKSVKFVISDEKAVKDWEIETRQVGTPISNYYKTWSETRKKDVLKQISNKDELDNYNIPIIKKPQVKERKEEEMKDAFESEEDSDGSDDDDDLFLTKKRKMESSDEDEEKGEDEDSHPPVKKLKTDTVDDDEDEESEESSIDDGVDEVKEMNLSDLEDEDEFSNSEANDDDDD